MGAFLETTRYLKEEGLKNIAAAVRKAVCTCTTRSTLTPRTSVTLEIMEKLFLDILREANSELLAKSRGAATLLPESIDEDVPEAHRERVKHFLDEARDYLESPQFMEVFQVVTTSTTRHLIGTLAEDTAGSSTSAAPQQALPLANGCSCPLAKLYGPIMTLCITVFNQENGNDFVDRFGKEKVVEELCEAL